MGLLQLHAILVDLVCFYADGKRVPREVEEDSDESDSKIGNVPLLLVNVFLPDFTPTGYGSDKDKAAAACSKQIEADKEICGHDCFEEEK